MNIFDCNEYQSFLKFKIYEQRGNLTKFAKSINCQPSYLLRTLNEEAQLTPDQAYKLCKSWGLDDLEREYFMTLVNYSRASDNDYKSYLETNIKQILHNRNNIKDVVHRQVAAPEQMLLEYHSNWLISFIHFLTACSKQNTLDQIAHRVGLLVSEVDEIVTLLKNNGLVEEKNKFVKFKTGTGHIPRGSPILPIFHSNWRQIAVQKSLRKDTTSLHYTNIQTVSKADLQKIIEQAKQFIQTSKRICDNSASEDVVAFNLDVFVP